jgi:hypothetical protein
MRRASNSRLAGILSLGEWGRSCIALSISLVGGQQIPLIAVEDLIANKVAVGRLQDLADVEALEAVRNR